MLNGETVEDRVNHITYIGKEAYDRRMKEKQEREEKWWD